MVTVSTLLIACLIAGVVSSIGTIGFFMLLSTYLSVKGIKAEKDEDDQGSYIMPLSGLSSMPQRVITQDDINRARDAILKGYKGEKEDEKEEYTPNKGSYI